MGWFRKPAGAGGAIPDDPQETPGSASDMSLDDSTMVPGGVLPRPRSGTDTDERVHFLVVVEGDEPGRRIH